MLNTDRPDKHKFRWKVSGYLKIHTKADASITDLFMVLFENGGKINLGIMQFKNNSNMVRPYFNVI